jgi:hypothetical protein
VSCVTGAGGRRGRSAGPGAMGSLAQRGCWYPGLRSRACRAETGAGTGRYACPSTPRRAFRDRRGAANGSGCPSTLGNGRAGFR